MTVQNVTPVAGAPPTQAPRGFDGIQFPQGEVTVDPQGKRVLLASANLGNQWAGAAGAPVATQTPVAGIDPDTPLSELSTAKLEDYGLTELAANRPATTFGEVRPLLGKAETLDHITDILSTRSDLMVGDFVSRTRDGKIRIDPSLYDDGSRELLTNQRTDLHPNQLSEMRGTFAAQLRNPAMASAASDKAMDLLAVRTDIQPEQASEMMGKMVNAVGGAGANNGPASAVNMFENGAELLKTRWDIQPHEVGQLAESVGKLGGQKDPGRAGQVANGFQAATRALQDNIEMPPGEMIKLADTMRERFPGEDAASSADRMMAFTQGVTMVTDHANLDADGVGAILQKASEGESPLRGGKLLNALSTADDAIRDGGATVDGLTAQRPRDPDQPLPPGDLRFNKERGPRGDRTGQPSSSSPRL